MTVLCSWLLAATLSPLLAADAMAPYRELPVLEVRVVAPPDEDTESLQSLIRVRPGFLLSSEDIRASVKRLYALGRFARVDVYAEQVARAVSLTFHLEYAIRLNRLVLEGVRRANEDVLREAINLEAGDDVDARTSAAVRARLLDTLHARGFPDAEVTVALATERELGLTDLIVTVEEGAPITLGAVRFVGDRVGPAPLLERAMEARRGDLLWREQLEGDAKRLQDLYIARGFLSAMVSLAEVQIEEREARVTFAVRAGPRIARHFVGNRALTDDELLRLWPTAPLDAEGVRTFAARVKDTYERLGLWRTDVQVRRWREPGRDAVQHLVFFIREGSPTWVSEVQVSGATELPSEVLIRQIVGTVEQALAPDDFFGPVDPSSSAAAFREPPDIPYAVPPVQRWIPSLYRKALSDIEAAYHDRGYLSAQVGPYEAEHYGNHVVVKVPVREGPRTHIESLTFVGNEVFESASLLERVVAQSAGAVAPAQPFSSNSVEDARINIVRQYRNAGYLYARVFTDVAVSEDGRGAAVRFRVEEGTQVRLEAVIVRGNEHTLEGLIRSRLTLEPGDVYRVEQALDDQRRVAELGVFSSVRVKLIDEETPHELKDLVTEVVERNRQPVELGFGISTADGPRVNGSYENINVFGTATTFSVSLALNHKILFGLYRDVLADRYDEFSLLERVERRFRVGLRSPRVLSLPFDPSFRFDLVQERENALPYSLESLAAILGVDLNPSQRLRISIDPQVAVTGLRCEDVNVETVSNDCLGTILARRSRIDAGLEREFKVGPSFTWDLRDDAFNPTRGLLISGEAFYATGGIQGPEALRQPGAALLGGSGDWTPFSFVRMEGTLSGYLPLFGTVLALSARAGTIVMLTEAAGGGFSPAPIDDRFYLGGRDTLRGFLESTLIPEDVQVDDSQEVPVSPGGHSFVLFKGELRVPVAKALSVGFFVDAGNLWYEYPNPSNFVLRLGTGVGLRYGTPVGPLALDFGFNPVPRPRNAEPTWQPHFAIGVF